MARQIVVCMDGTWNDPTERTNVYKLFHMLPGTEDVVSEKGPIRSHVVKDTTGVVAFYLEGVGAKGRQQGALGGGLGIGLHDRVIDAFVLVSQRYRPGDKIWIFGFSRGSWSARSLGGLIAGAGLLDAADQPDAADRAEKLWIDFKHQRTVDRGNDFWSGKDDRPIRMIGVWDTVGALGIPFFNGLRVIDRLERQLFDFADTALSPRVEYGAHALAIDETRFDFTPTPWTDRAGIEQVWFAGVHADVGGGYSRAALSDVALQWMAERVTLLGAGLTLDTATLGDSFRPDPLADRHDEGRKSIWKLRPRDPRAVPANALLHSSVLTRLGARPDYRPAAIRSVASCARFYPAGEPLPAERLLPQRDTLPTRRLEVGATSSLQVFAQNWWNAAGLEVKRGETYRIAAQGQWTDRKTETSADGYPSDSTLLGWFEGSRRVESANWFALVAAVHPEPGLETRNPDSGNFITGTIESLRTGVGDADGKSQRVAVGRGKDLAVAADGYLYFFANDSAFAYSNNSGFLIVRVERLA